MRFSRAREKEGRPFNLVIVVVFKELFSFLVVVAIRKRR